MTMTADRWRDRYVMDVLSSGGQPRRGQAELITVGLADEGVHLVKAPTATGKTYGALYAAALRAIVGQRTVISTFTKLLQDQYAGKDLESIRRAFPDVSFAVLKGANNYVCLDHAAAVKMNAASNYELSQIKVNWEDKGGAWEIPAGVTPLTRMKIQGDAKFCRGHKPETCGFIRAREEAGKAQVVITNHTLTLLNARFPKLLGTHELLVVDEIHNLPRAAEGVGTQVLDFDDIELGLAQAGMGDLIGHVVDIGQMLLPAHDEDWTVDVETLRDMAAIWKHKVYPEINLAVDPNGHLDNAFVLQDWIGQSIKLHKEGIGGVSAIPTVKGRPYGKDEKWQRRQICLAHVDLRDICRPALTVDNWSEDEPGHKRTVLMMSATTGTPDHPGYVAERCGLPTEDKWTGPMAETKVPAVKLHTVASPIDYGKQMRLSVVMANNWGKSITEMCMAMDGRTLVLLRSWARVESVTDYLETFLPDHIKVYRQDRQDPKANAGILAAFRDDVSSVLVGTASFFEGIDVPGESLSQVIIGELPIPMTLDRVAQERRRRAGRLWTYGTAIPHTALIVEQMMGRLLRRPDDRGLAVILDDAAQKGWGQVAVEQAAEAMGVPIVSRFDALSWWASES